MDMSNETFSRLAEEAKEEADDLLKQIKNLGALSRTVIRLFEKLPLEKIKIDNTGK